MKKKKSIKSNWYNWLINYIPKPIRKTVGRFQDKVVSLFKTNTQNYSKQTVYWLGKKLNKLKMEKQSEEHSIIKNIKNLFKLKK